MRSEYWLCTFLVLSSCAIDLNYQAPEVNIPCEWHNKALIMNDACPEEVAWWEGLKDPLLTELLRLAASQNLDLQIAANRVLQARAQANAKKAGLYPHIDGSLTYGHVHWGDERLVDRLLCEPKKKSCHSKRNLNFFEIGFDAEWELDFFGLSKYEIAALKANEEAVQESLSAIWVTLSAEIAKNYIELRGLQQRLKINHRSSDLQVETLKLIGVLLKRGLIKESDYAHAQAEWSTLQAVKTQIECQITFSIHKISILLGLTPGELHDCLLAEQNLPKLPCELSIGIPSDLLRRRPDIRKAEREVAAATERIGSAIANLFPRFSLRGFLGEVSANTGSLFNSSNMVWFFGPQVLVPIFNSRLILQDVNYNKLKTQETLILYQKTVLEALEEAENAIIAFKCEEQRLKHLNEAYQENKKALVFTQELYQRGVNDLFAVTSAQKLLFAAEEAALQSQVLVILNYISLYKALGGSWGRCEAH